MIIIISLIDKSNTLHYEEFVRPVIDIVKENYEVVNYEDLNEEIINKSSRIIICGTSLREGKYMNNCFDWVRKYNKPMLGICAGSQLIAKEFGALVKEGKEIGIYSCEIVNKNKLIENINLNEIYVMHRLSFVVPNKFILIAKTKYPQIIKHESKEIYGVLFHPEVKNKKLIENFISL